MVLARCIEMTIRNWLVSIVLVSVLMTQAGPVPARDLALEARLTEAFTSGELPGLHSALIIHQGETLAELYFPGADESWGQALGVREHGPDSLHDLRSVTKSITSLLYGIALSEGLVPSVDEPVVSQFPEYADLATDPARQAILIRHVLSMRMGTAWDESLPYTDPRNSEIAMELAQDRYRYVLEQPIISTPGEQWNYSGGATALIGRLIAKGAGMPLDAYAREKLFTPLGISHFEWKRGGDGEPSAASGLRMTASDLARIGLMIQNGGRHAGQQIVPEDWLKQSFRARASLRSGLRYGFFWWLHPKGDPPLGVAGFGNGGQRLSIGLESGLIVVVFAGNYNDPQAWKIPVKVLTDFALPAVGNE